MPTTKKHRALRGYEQVEAALEGVPGRVHMLGIGGVGMAGLALLLKERGWQVTGCDTYPGALLSWLDAQGIQSEVGHDACHLDTRPDFIVRSPAVSPGEGELIQAQRMNIPVIERGRILPGLLHHYRTIAVAGTHGKTTTASLIAWIIKQTSEKTSYCIGGVCPCLGAVAHAEKEGTMVVEADESDGTLRYYEPDAAVVTSMDIDHVDFFRDTDTLISTYREFAYSARLVVYHVEDPNSADMLESHPCAVSVGLTATADIHAENILLESDRCEFDVINNKRRLGRVCLGVPGRHNILNALSAMAVCLHYGVEFSVISRALSSFRLPLRRYELVVKGTGVTVVADYAHHPVEIAALLAQAQLTGAKRILGVFQPHRYSRTKAFLASFVDVLSKLDHVVLAPVYSASEPFIAGGTSDDLYREFCARGLERQCLAHSVPHAWELLRPLIKPGDLVLIIGAGDVEIIGTWAKEVFTEKAGNKP